VNFGGVIKQVNLSYVPEAKVNDYVIVHVGFALSIVDEEEAEQVFKYLKAIGELSEIEGESNVGAV
jgi:hydrogenase expression/formation protein HypC